ncbi:uncharacterized protein DUF1232 [Novosphingobium kunmingense]|uniref:Uncharacterized protein DUF1232 n=1 Tax=Novosphingobium kunmingense TaxID=1211806 RepID=A0A2N0HJY1_9SPHN|nr:DUF1232 domain-containing protein [Novosphingobium kunmingense]PKB19257.1 uncharacterized protein DUF1232 [Novosphingobium kunmingense]
MTWRSTLSDWARRLKADALALWLAARDPRVPVPAKALALVVAAYAFSPIDLIPDFIPVLGLVDDLLIVPLGIWLAIRLIPPALFADLRARAARMAQRPVSRGGALAVAIVWLGICLAAAWFALPFIGQGA